jgi:pimeloyl-ACP methyl ester carboxylesterase
MPPMPEPTPAACLIILVLGLQPACSTLSQEISIQAEGRAVRTDDGYPLATYELRLDGAPPPPRGILFYLQGSESTSVLSAVGHLAGATAAGFRVILAERRGIGFNGAIEQTVALEGSTRQQRVADHRAVIDWFLREKPAGLPVVLVGTSEGGDVAAAVAAAESRVTHVVLIGCGGGWSQAQEFLHELERHGSVLGLKSREALDDRFRAIRQNPDSLELWAGHPYRRWSSFLWSPPVDDLVRVSAPILLVHGDADRSVPVESARAMVDAFWARGKRNLTYREYRDVDHRLIDVTTKRSAFPRVEVDLLAWSAETGLVPKSEADRLAARVRRAHPDAFDRASRPTK